MRYKSQRGAALTEYAILLAFIAAIAVSFSSDGLGKSIAGAIDKVVAVFDMNKGSGNLLAGNSQAQAKATFINGNLQDWGTKIGIFGSLNDDGTCNLIALKPDTTYEITVDIEKMKTDYNLEMDKEADLGIFIWDQSTTGAAPVWDTRDMTTASSKEYDYYTQEMRGKGAYVGSSVSAVLSDDGKTMTYTFKTQGDQSYLGMALQYSSIKNRDEKMATLAQNYQSFLSLRKAK